MSIKENLFDYSGFSTLNVISKADRFNKWMYEITRPYLSGHILEIGSGIGNISKFFIHSGATISLSDINPHYLQSLQEEYNKYSNVKSISYIDLQHPSFKEEYSHYKHQFDSLFILNVLEHLENENTALDNCSFLLKPKGVIVVLVPAYSFLYSKLDRDLGHYRRYTKPKLVNLLKSRKFSIKKSFYFNAVGILGWIYLKILKLRRLPNSEMQFYDKLVPLSKRLDAFLANKIGISVIAIAMSQDLQSNN